MIWSTTKKAEITDPLLKRLSKISDGYNEKDENYKFKSLFYNYKGSTNPSKPIAVQQNEWDTALGSVPSEFHVPSYVLGFKGLETRRAQQKKVITSMQNKIAYIRCKIAMQQEKANQMESTFETLQKNSQEINHLLLQRLKKDEVEFLRGRQLCSEERNLLAEVEQLQQSINKPNQYVSKLNTLRLRATLMKDVHSTQTNSQLSIQNPEKLQEFLSIEMKAINTLSDQLKSIKKSVAAIENMMKKEVLDQNSVEPKSG